ncbi:mannose ABC transporter membrane protein /fructose ABC transporter membrane protein /ribose ABC transporter membrane protein [Cribrihabitans marinus]|uniref:Mannose ABC transporter membrane protein /fructose ABC transporter membrane protein /ribose ABC transporter membrane protein n=1 Tax=Cribrihabitans marinus TaxID=1227549 RepID=A0A1H7D9U0_9RHOB|nr:ABC transporter permease [Cribrihabitans marinus]GGH37559.1 ABC transporter permease [Cribrihabitans marinus]SEJ95930.1 mannose ABC transporter membrane protein /fructose ABC transporter membrane protein /ribose ABC transporter membrane protein [Cribrihabitans marinus]
MPESYESSASRDQSVAEFDSQGRTLGHRLQHALHVTPSLVPLMVLIAAVVVFGLLLGQRFLSPFALTLILQQVQIVGIVALAQSLVILTAGIDLSVGAVMVLSSVVMGQFTFRYGLPPGIAVMSGLLCGALCGLVSGVLVAIVKLPPFIVTLGMWQVVLAGNFLYSRNETIRSQDIEAAAPLLQFFGTRVEIGGAIFTFGVLFMLILAVVLAYALRFTAWGRHVYAVGDDPEAAALSGVNVRGTLISVYVLAGTICAFAGWTLIGRIGSVSPTSGQLANIESITAVVIGGISLFGGRGSILGTLFGALIVGVFTLGLRLAGADPQWTNLLIGILIIAAVAVDQWIRRATV